MNDRQPEQPEQPREPEQPRRPRPSQQAQRTEERGGNSAQKPLAIVGIGASAGGLAALKALFSQMPPDPGVAFVIVVHLSPEHESHLAEILQQHCSFPVQQVSATIDIKPNHVYVIPPNANLNTIDTHLRLSDLETERRRRAPIDHFFRTLAETHDGDAIGVVLSGTGSDGALGLRRIKQAGGLTISQDPEEAEHDGMPRSAIASGMVDMVLPLQKIPEVITTFAQTRPDVPRLADGDDVQGDENRTLQKIFGQLRVHTGHDFSQYKRSTIMRRIQRRMQIHRIESLSAYLKLLRDDREEPRALFNDLLITVTEFFRDAPVFEHLEQQVIPRLFEGKGAGDRLRIWSVGCSTGEEAYTLAMLLLEEAARRDEAPEIQVFASDLHQQSLQCAREGRYPEEIAADVSPERLRRFFTKDRDQYRVRREVRELVVFAPHNLLGDPPFSHLDLIVCRNVLIYLQRDVQQDVIAVFHYALEPDGLLLLGTSETVDRNELFICESKEARLYRKRNVPSREPRLPVFPLARGGRWGGSGHAERTLENEPGPRCGALHERMVERYAPPSVLVNEAQEIVHSSVNAGRYLRVPGGEPTSNVLKLVHESLQLELRAALHAAREARQSVRSKPIPLDLEGAQRRVTIEVHPAKDDELAGFFLILFDELTIEPLDVDPNENSADERQGVIVREMGAELEINRQRLQAVIEEHETSREDMQASNEELQSANEELRSTLEELETSKEELHSMNEELATVNQENRHRVEELSQLTADLANLMAATAIPTLFLDRDLRILRFTPQVADLFNIRHSDRGRPLSDITHHLGYPDLQDDARRVLDRLLPVEREVQDSAQHWHLTRILPYRASDDRIEGIVITFVDITSRRKMEQSLRESEERFRALVDGSAQMVWTTDAQGSMVDDSPTWRAFTGQTAEERKGRGWLLAIHPEDRSEIERIWRESIASGEPLIAEFRIHHAPSKQYRWTSVRAVPLRNNDQNIRGWVGMNIDIGERKQHEEQMHIVMAELNHRVKNTLAVIQALAMQTVVRAPDLESFADRFNERLQAMAKAHGLLTRTDWRGVFLRDILTSEIDPHVAEGDHLALHGPEVTLHPNATLAMHMVVHELTTNACKYGCFTSTGGRLEITWAVADHWLHIHWNEHAHHHVSEPEQEGYGTTLITHLVSYELHGNVERRFEPEGLKLHISVPLRSKEA